MYGVMLAARFERASRKLQDLDRVPSREENARAGGETDRRPRVRDRTSMSLPKRLELQAFQSFLLGE